MDKNIQATIIEQSEILFRAKGYNKTSMRQIAEACNIAVGNLCYYFPKKEDIVMVHHDNLMNSFYEQILQNPEKRDPWVFYFSTEYKFLYNFIIDAESLRLYKEVINLPLLRNEYYKRHHELFLEILSEVDLSDSENELFMSTVAMCSLEFQLLEQYDSFTDTWEFDNLVKNIFKTRLIFLNEKLDVFQDIIDEAITLGKDSCL